MKAEFPHLWQYVEKFQGGKSEYSTDALQKLLGKQWQKISGDLIAIGFLKMRGRIGQATYWIPYLYRKGLELTRGRA